MRSYAFVVAWLLLWQLPVLAQNPHQQVISSQAETMAKATVNGDYKVLADYTYPKIIDMMGGKEAMVALVAQSMQQLESQGIVLVSVKFGKPEALFTAGKELHCLVPQTVELKLNAGNMEQESFVLAVSQDKGKNWYFIDTSLLPSDRIIQLFDFFNEDLKIPAPKEPVFVER